MTATDPALWGARSVPDVSRVTEFGTVDLRYP
jgi:hypothetical protein